MGEHAASRSPRSGRRLVFAGLVAFAVAGAAALPLGTAFAADDYPGPSVSPTVLPDNGGRTPVEVGGKTATRSGGSSTSNNNGVEVLGIQVTRGSIPFTGGDVVGLATIGAGTAAVGALLVHRSRASRVAAVRDDD